MPDPAAMPPPPEFPEASECCGGGCCPCIYDYYQGALDKWKAQVRELGGDPDALLKARKPSS